MPFRILYLEDRDATLIVDAIHRGDWSGPDIRVIQEEKVENLPRQLKSGFDLLLADIGFPIKGGKDENRLDEILAAVAEHAAEWRRNNPEVGLASLPVIVYTSRKEDIEDCLKQYRHRLYDIWDKATASPEYVAWRVGVVARDVERRRPGRALQQSIEKLNPAVPWHDRVLRMLRQYRSAWSELDQIQRCGDTVKEIAAEIGCEDGTDMWRALYEWELLDRAADRRVRGHGRHSLHVFWLGYVLINEPSLREIWRKAWKSVLERHPDREVKKIDWHEALNNTWFLASVFHDVGYAAQDAKGVVAAVHKIASLLHLDLMKIKPNPRWGNYKDIAEDVLSKFENAHGPGYEQLRAAAKADFARSVKEGHPDHGCMSAGRMAAAKSRAATHADWYLAEAARAVVLHSMIPEVVSSTISWEVDPLATLLLLLDQLQTWDRERPPELNSDWPERAELTKLEITEGTRPRIDLRVRYLVRSHVEREAEVFDKVEENLRRVLQQLPIATIRRMQPRLPFDIAVEFFLAETKIDQVIPS